MAGKTIQEVAIENLQNLGQELTEWEKTGYFNQRKQLGIVSRAVAALLEFQIKILKRADDPDRRIVLPEGVKIE